MTKIRYCFALILGLTVLAMPQARAGTAPLFAVQLTANAASTKVTIGIGRAAPYHVTPLGPERIAVDFDGVSLTPAATVASGIGLVRSYHAERIDDGVRLVLDLVRPAAVASSQALPGSRVLIELTPGAAPAVRAAALPLPRPPAPAPFPAKPPPRSDGPQDDGPDEIAALLAEPQPAPKPAAKPVAAKTIEPEPREEPVMPVAAVVEPLPARKGGRTMEAIISPRRTIVIDAGHGGIDPGAESVAGYHEKEITLATARVLARTLEATGRYKVVLTRDSDVYLKLHERVARARAAHGDMFISLHADSAVSDRSTRGASIYTLSETASDAESDRYAQRENRADAIGGVDLGKQNDDVAGILVDLTVRETVNDGNRLAGMMVDSLEHHSVMLLPSTPHRSAGFAVLKSPDIPSVLIEMGYLSDMADARALADPRHQQQIAGAIADGVDRYFAWLQVSRS
ncbi:MAG TPA: N-acetylmuramoyl-L-alanine amidase [Alphaproteobacteria bacterium]|nr:N-acetylmuramoyl-L-alanine amidase [Alphaproteobacteria bacterium]